MADISPVNLVYSFVGCNYLAEFVAKAAAHSTTVVHVILVYTHLSFLTDFGFLGDGDKEDASASNLSDHFYCGNAKMPAGQGYPSIVLMMTTRRRDRMLAKLRNYEEVKKPDHWVDIKEKLVNKNSRDAYLSSYVQTYLDHDIGDRAANSTERYVPGSSAPPTSEQGMKAAATTSSKKRKDEGKGRAGTDESEELAALRVLVAQQSARIEELEGTNKELKKTITWQGGQLLELKKEGLMCLED
jgi:hypothetical protein